MGQTQRRDIAPSHRRPHTAQIIDEVVLVIMNGGTEHSFTETSMTITSSRFHNKNIRTIEPVSDCEISIRRN